MVLMNLITATSVDTAQAPPLWAAFAVGLGVAVFGIIWQMLYLGLLATAYTDGCNPRQPGELVNIGRRFFWRFVCFQIILAIVFMAASFAVAAFINPFIAERITPENITKYLPWPQAIISFVVSIILAKPLLITPAIMIVDNCYVIEAVTRLKKYQLLKAQNLLGLFVIVSVINSLFSIAIDFTGQDGTFHYIAMAMSMAVLSTLSLILYLSAVKFVADKESLSNLHSTLEKKDI